MYAYIRIKAMLMDERIDNTGWENSRKSEGTKLAIVVLLKSEYIFVFLAQGTY